ncbi:TIM-barrel domain-containing protein [Pelobium manganitolerans]|uniref:glycoside hydrolase family 31 protein n=1 Tax=Pelobium manganitolerans TaxID=1842495 RepID=UPI003FA36152
MSKYFNVRKCCFFLAVNLSFALASQAQSNFQKIENGVQIKLAKPAGQTEYVNIQFATNRIAHVSARLNNATPVANGIGIILKSSPVAYTQSIADDSITLKSNALTVKASLTNGGLAFYDANNRSITKELSQGREFTPTMFDGDAAYAIKQYFLSDANEAYYGLGQHQQGFINYKGRQVELLQNNTEVAVPFLYSSKNYGILWDNASITKAGDVRQPLELNALKLISDGGEQGWLSNRWALLSRPDSILLAQPQALINFSFLEDQKLLPKAFKLDHAVSTWSGKIGSSISGKHQLVVKFGGYLKIWFNNQLVADTWRKAWNPLTSVFDLQLEAGKTYDFKIEWRPDGGESYLDVKTIIPNKFAQEETFALSSEAGEAISYYLIAGSSADDVIAGYRELSGKATMLPKWAFGLWQSRERYKTQKELLDVVKEYRKRQIPLDNIVQDWSFWKENDWGSQDFDETRFPDATQMIKDVHAMNANFMISVWPKFYEGIPVYKDFYDKGFLYKRNIADQRRDWIGKGYTSSFYDAFNPEARKAFWHLIDEKLYKRGVDAWWLDATEPDVHSNLSIATRKQLITPNYLGSSEKYFNAFPLFNAQGVYEGQRQENPDKRVFILTRSAFTGLQHYGSVTWSGDIGSRWEDMKNQIGAGVNFSLSGLPYWTMDIGGFVVEARYEKPNAASLEEWREQMSRWFQFGVFTPLTRLHGQFPFREIYNVAPENHPAYKSMVYYDQLRYRLMPYIYSLAGKTYQQDYTPMRGLVMDFANDEKVLSINDQYLFGPSLLVNPVTAYQQSNRQVYLPKGQGWFDLYSGQYFAGGQNIKAAAPYDKMPVFVKEGSIIPIGPALQYVSEKPAEPITLYVYGGKDAEFTLYEDDGLSYGYEKGAFSQIQIGYSQNTKTLTIKQREGSYPNMLNNRTFNVVFIDAKHKKALDFNQKPTKTINYNGNEVSVKF